VNLSFNIFTSLVLVELCMFSVELNPVPTKEMVTHYNELRQDIVLLYELKLALANCQYELQTLRHRYETLATDRVGITFNIFHYAKIVRLLYYNVCNENNHIPQSGSLRRKY